MSTILRRMAQRDQRIARAMKARLPKPTPEPPRPAPPLPKPERVE